MADYIDFFNRDVMGSVQAFTGFYFFIRLLQQKVKTYYYFLFIVSWFIIMKVVLADRITELLVFTFLLIASGVFICHTNWKSVILYAVLTVEVMQLSYGIVNSLLSILYPLMFFFNQKVVGFAFMLFGNFALLLAMFCYHMICQYFSFYETIEKKYAPMVFIPILMIFFMGEYINSIMYRLNFMDSSVFILYTNYYPMLVIQIFGMASLFCIMSAYKKLLQNFRFRTELSLLEQEEHFLNRYVEEAKAHYEKTKSFRHDIKNHITIIKELLQRGKTGQALNYIGDMEDITEELSFPYSTDNPVVDILIGNKFGIAKRMGIAMSCQLILPYPCLVRDIDFCIILSNALDNAIQACRNVNGEGEKYIHLTGHIQGDFILMEIENSFQGNGLIQQGTGLSNIKAVAEKYQGAMSIKTQRTIFILSVLLIIPQYPERDSHKKDR
ncbi:MAG: GHKL domain-containing protein [Lachnospiraceae bacterium]|nr:GHKL domain-containing protein [Lachnospiraceae bacterium]